MTDLAVGRLPNTIITDRARRYRGSGVPPLTLGPPQTPTSLVAHPPFDELVRPTGIR